MCCKRTNGQATSKNSLPFKEGAKGLLKNPVFVLVALEDANREAKMSLISGDGGKFAICTFMRRKKNGGCECV